MLDICKKARERGIRTHLDGARLYIASAYTSIAPDEYAAPFDTVYVSLWKYFNSLNGAILAGPKDVLDGMFHTRRMFGGALYNAWPFAVLAHHYASGYLDHMKNAIAVSEQFIKEIDGTDVRVERVRNGTNIFRLVVPAPRADKLRERLAQQRVILPQPAEESSGMVFWLQVNETWNRTTGSRLAGQFSSALR
jgi:threonine aldolase